jgi:hypothetical protein
MRTACFTVPISYSVIRYTTEKHNGRQSGYPIVAGPYPSVNLAALLRVCRATLDSGCVELHSTAGVSNYTRQLVCRVHSTADVLSYT